MLYYKAEARDDVLFIEAENLDEAQGFFQRLVKDVPVETVTFTKVEDLPEGVIPFTFETTGRTRGYSGIET